MTINYGGQNGCPLQSLHAYLLTLSHALSNEHNVNEHTRETPNTHYLAFTRNVPLDIDSIILPAGSPKGYLASCLEHSI